MQTDSWRADDFICAVTHGPECKACHEYRAHALKAVLNRDAAFADALSEGKQRWSSGQDGPLSAQYTQLVSEFQLLKEDYVDMKRSRDQWRDDFSAAAERVKSLEMRLSEKEEELDAALEGKARYRALASGKGKAKADDPIDIEPVAKRVRTLSLHASSSSHGDVPMAAPEEFPPLPTPSAPISSAGPSLRPAPGTVVPPRATASRPVAGPSRLGVCDSSSALRGGVRRDVAKPNLVLVPTPRTLDEVKARIEKAHEGVEGHRPSIEIMRQFVSQANADARAKRPLNEAQKYALIHWRVPKGVEKSEDRVRRALGYGPAPPTKRKRDTDRPAPNALLDALDYDDVLPAAPVLAAASPQATVPTPMIVDTAASASSSRPEPSPAPQVTDTDVPMESVLSDPAVVVAVATASTSTVVTKPSQWDSILDDQGNLPIVPRNQYEADRANILRCNAARLDRNPKAVLGFRKVDGVLPSDVYRRLEWFEALLRAAPLHCEPRRHFLLIAMAILLSRGAYQALVALLHPNFLNSVVLKSTPSEWPRKTTKYTVELVVRQLVWSGVTPLEASTWDPFVLAWCEDYLASPGLAEGDEIRLAMQDRLFPPADPRNYQILGCLGQVRYPVYSHKLAGKPGDYYPGEVEVEDDEDDLGDLIVMKPTEKSRELLRKAEKETEALEAALAAEEAAEKKKEWERQKARAFANDELMRRAKPFPASSPVDQESARLDWSQATDKGT
jgi:hypothetical protein